MNLIKKIQNGDSEDALNLMKQFDENFLGKVLNWGEFQFLRKIVNHVDFSKLAQIVIFIPQEFLKAMALSENGLAFKSMLLSSATKEYLGMDFKEDFKKKSKFFLKIDKEYFSVLFNDVGRVFKTQLMKEIFNELVKK